MNSLSFMTIGILLGVAGTMGLIIVIYCMDGNHRKKPKHRYKLVFNIHHHKTRHQMAIVSSLTLTSVVAQTLTLSVVDENNNNQVIPGVLSGLVVTPADPNQDTAVLNPNVVNGLDVDAIANDGGTTVTAEADFASDKKKTDGTPVVSGHFIALLTLVNNVVVSAKMVFNTAS